MKKAIIHCLQAPSPSSGIYRRLTHQAAAARREKLFIDFHVITGAAFPGQGDVRQTVIGKHATTLGKNRAEAEAVASIMSEYDVICMRNILFSHHYFKIFKDRPCKLITEIHGKHLTERRLESFKLFAYEALMTSPCMAVNDGFVPMTDELGTYAQAFVPWRSIPSATIPNGIDVEDVQETGFKPFDGNELHVCMVAGIDAPWHGWERLAAGLAAYDGPVKTTLHLIGALPGPTTESIGSHGIIHRHGPLYGRELDELMGNMNLAAATLGLYRKGQQQACALKTRDYMARGLPFILGYDDVDIPEDNPFCLHVPNDNSPIDFKQLILFSKKMSAKPEQSSSPMRVWAMKHLDWTVKMRQYDRFMRTVAEN